MFIQKLDPDKFGEAYNVKGQLVYPWEGVVTPPFGAGWGVIEPGGATKHHNHQEGETFFFIKGRGRMQIGDEVQEVGPGDVVYHPPFNGHILQNPSDTEDLLFLSLWWEDRQLWEGRRESAVLAEERPRRMVVAAALPASGPLRLDTLAGPALAADVLVRYLRLRGVDARLAPLGGEVSGEAVETLAAAGIEIASGAVPDNSAQALFERLQASGRLVEEGGRLSLPLRDLEKPLKDFYLKVGMGTHLRALLEQALAEGLAVPVTQPGGALSPELIAAARAAERLQAEETKVVECFGFEDALLHALHVPALLLAADPGAVLPAAFVTHEALDPALEAGSFLAGTDVGSARYYLAAARPETAGTGSDRHELAAVVERDLIQGWQPWLAELGGRLRQERDGDIPWTGDWTEEHRRFYQRLEDLIREAGEAYEARTFSPQRVTRVIAELVRTARRFGQGEEHWRHVPARSEERRTSLALELLAAKAMVYVTAPLLPEVAARLWHDLGFDTPLSEVRWEDRPEWIPGGQKLRDLGQPYFVSAESRAA
jgi:mannose-6-phosphate isomerase-like protein (cupin superfamily)